MSEDPPQSGARSTATGPSLSLIPDFEFALHKDVWVDIHEASWLLAVGELHEPGLGPRSISDFMDERISTQLDYNSGRRDLAEEQLLDAVRRGAIEAISTRKHGETVSIWRIPAHDDPDLLSYSDVWWFGETELDGLFLNLDTMSAAFPSISVFRGQPSLPKSAPDGAQGGRVFPPSVPSSMAHRVRGGGRSAKYDWDQFYLELVVFVHENGSTRTLADLVQAMAMRCQEIWGVDNVPSDTVLKSKLSRVFHRLRSET